MSDDRDLIHVDGVGTCLPIDPNNIPCPVCHHPVDDREAHFPHDRQCRNWGRSPIRGESAPYGCHCDRLGVHSECCSECEHETRGRLSVTT